MATPFQYLKLERLDEIALLTIDRPDKLNALNSELIGELDAAIREIAGDAGLRGVVLTGAGEKAFVAGADIGELAGLDPRSAVTTSRRGQEVLDLLEGMPKPVVAAVNGFALGGGLELALACHIRVAGEGARFALPEVKLGIIPGYGGTVRLPRLIGRGRALEMILTGEMIDAEEAYRIGLVNRVVPQADLLETAMDLVRKITSNGPIAVSLALESVYHGADTASSEALRHEASLFGVLASTSDMREGMTAFIEKRAASFEGR